MRDSKFFVKIIVNAIDKIKIKEYYVTVVEKDSCYIFFEKQKIFKKIKKQLTDDFLDANI